MSEALVFAFSLVDTGAVLFLLVYFVSFPAQVQNSRNFISYVSVFVITSINMLVRNNIITHLKVVRHRPQNSNKTGVFT